MPIRIPLANGDEVLVDEQDAGLARWKWFPRKEGNGKVYATRSSRGTTLYLHNEILPAPPPLVVDHEDGDSLNCQRSNLRHITRAQNRHNVEGGRADNTSGHLGVFFHRQSGKWEASIQTNGKRRTIGRYPLKEDAVAARLAAEAQEWGIQPRRREAHGQ